MTAESYLVCPDLITIATGDSSPYWTPAAIENHMICAAYAEADRKYHEIAHLELKELD